jgi:hydroxymethylglutaryl-CoA lyase
VTVAPLLTEVGLRDGLQMAGARLATDTKIDLARKLAAAGYRRLEVGSFVSPKAVPAMADTDRVLAGLADLDGVELQVLVANSRGVEQAMAAGVDTINIVVATTETMSQRNARCSVQQSVDVAVEAMKTAGNAGVAVILATAWGCPYEGPVDAKTTLGLADQLVEVGLRRLTVADTIGVATPRTVGALVAELRARHPEVELALHAHDTRGMGLANVMAAIDAGVNGLDVALGGLGGCPFAGKGAAGNVASEEVIGLLDDLGMPSGVSLDEVARASAAVAAELGTPLPSRRLALYQATGSAR